VSENSPLNNGFFLVSQPSLHLGQQPHNAVSVCSLCTHHFCLFLPLLPVFLPLIAWVCLFQDSGKPFCQHSTSHPAFSTPCLTYSSFSHCLTVFLPSLSPINGPSHLPHSITLSLRTMPRSHAFLLTSFPISLTGQDIPLRWLPVSSSLPSTLHLRSFNLDYSSSKQSQATTCLFLWFLTYPKYCIYVQMTVVFLVTDLSSLISSRFIYVI
jgi:hypothetical protein